MKLMIYSCRMVMVTFLLLMTCESVSAQSNRKNCKSLEGLVIESSWTQSGAGSWTLTLKFDDSQLGVYAVMISQPGKETKIYKNKEKRIEGLRSGLYDVLIVDQKGCSKQLNLNIK